MREAVLNLRKTHSHKDSDDSRGEDQSGKHDRSGHDHASAAKEKKEDKHHGHNGHGEHGGHDAHDDGHDKHAGHDVAMFRTRFWVCLILSIPALIWEPMLQEWFGYRAPVFPGAGMIPAVFGTIVFIYGGWIFLKGAFHELSDRLPGMMTLIALAISVAFFYSVAVLSGFEGQPLWWELATLVTIMLLGHWIEMRSIFQAKGALKELAKLLPDTAERLLDGDRTEEVPIEELREGDLVMVRPGANIPVDGIVQDGKSAVNEALITGESKPVKKTAGDHVIAGTANGEGSLRVEVSEAGEETALAGIMRMVEEAQGSRSRSQDLADRAAYYLALVAIGSAGLTIAGWLAFGASLDFSITRMVTVLVIACPHALGLAIPLVIAISTTLGAHGGLLVRDRRGLEQARNLQVIVFDKTGTLTLGEHRVIDVVTAEGVDADEALRLAAAAEHDSEHPIAGALSESARESELQVPGAEDFHAIPGHGVEARVEGRDLKVGGPALLKKFSIDPPDDIRDAVKRFSDEGQAVVYLIEGDRVRGVFAIADAIRPESVDAVRDLQKENMTVAMLTGDSRAVAEAVAKKLGIDTVFAEVLPDDKAYKIKELQRDGRRVAMVGDGVNDAPALATADIGIAIGAGTDVAVEAGDVVLVRNDPRDVARFIKLSRATYRKMIQNLWWAAGYNIVAIPLAAGVLAWAGILLAPAVGAILMSASTVIVAINAQLLRRLEL
ncbi:heavy metal translocating P-type ATPase [Desulfatitalea alkaliphila]|uniref:Heavy metal translocating P-type ATPase n=1 Tax=Desulfatitalea alkaliphila TaxID=2929485 RepID=A0AA41QXZ0_9BACT|nr:heavy metal translocating P-type ATPase [Desulfatitalea alkaliphila]MCJ8498992.1 heavy metal translocating P-type ATPase [Desulfatitalea alkaliphila]